MSFHRTAPKREIYKTVGDKFLMGGGFLLMISGESVKRLFYSSYSLILENFSIQSAIGELVNPATISVLFFPVCN